MLNTIIECPFPFSHKKIYYLGHNILRLESKKTCMSTLYCAIATMINKVFMSLEKNAITLKLSIKILKLDGKMSYTMIIVNFGTS